MVVNFYPGFFIEIDHVDDVGTFECCEQTNLAIEGVNRSRQIVIDLESKLLSDVVMTKVNITLSTISCKAGD